MIPEDGHRSNGGAETGERAEHAVDDSGGAIKPTDRNPWAWHAAGVDFIGQAAFADAPIGA
jgi:hypothetical protein